jgi:hypothetical protein
MAFDVLKVHMLKDQGFTIDRSLSITTVAGRALGKGFAFSPITKIPF